MTSGTKSENDLPTQLRCEEVRYRREPSLPLLCVPACLNMILTRRGYPPISQADIARQLGLVVPQRLRDTYPFAEISETFLDWGIRPVTAEARIKSILRERAPTLHHTFRGWQEVPTSSQLEFIAEHLTRGNDVAVGFRASDIYDDAQPVGHVALIVDLDSRAELVRLMDPEVGTQEGVVVSWHRLLSGVMAVRDGYWLFGENAPLLEARFAL